MLTGLIQGLRSVAHVGASAVRVGLRRASRPFPLVGGLVGDMTRSRSELIAENALLRQQLIVASSATKRPVFLGHERGLLVLLARFVPLWRSALLLVKPETVLRWHREGFRLWWRWRSRCRRSHQPRLAPDVIALIRRMSMENRLWGAERIRGELLKLGVRVAKRTVQRYMRGARPSEVPRGQPWLTFLRNHTVWACDFLQTYDIGFRPVFAFFIIDVNSKRVVHVAVTRAPTSTVDGPAASQRHTLRRRPKILDQRSGRQIRGSLRSRRQGRGATRRDDGGGGGPDEFRVREIPREREARVYRPRDHPG